MSIWLFYPFESQEYLFGVFIYNIHNSNQTKHKARYILSEIWKNLETEALRLITARGMVE